MPVKRQNTGATIGAGGAKSIGTVNPTRHSSFDKGPDFGRLMNSLGIVSKVAAKQTEQDVTDAEMAIRQAHLDTKAPLPSEMPRKGDTAEIRQAKSDAKRERSRLAVVAVREKYKDNQGWFNKIFTDGNPAVKAADDLNARLRVADFKRASSILAQNKEGASHEDQVAALDKMASRERGIMEAYGTDAHKSYINHVTDHTLALRDQIDAKVAQRALAKSNMENLTVNVTGALTDIASVTGITNEEANTDIASNNKRAELQAVGTPAFEKQWSRTMQGMDDVHKKSMALNEGNRIKASQDVANYLTQVATQTGNHELLRLADHPLDSDGEKLSTFHAGPLRDAKQKIIDTQSKLNAHLVVKEERRVAKLNKADYLDFSTELDKFSQAAANSDDPLEDMEQFESVAKLRADLEKGSRDGDYDNNKYQLKIKMDALRATELSMDNTNGDPATVDRTKLAMLEDTYTVQDFFDNAHKLDPLTKATARRHIEPELKAKAFRQQSVLYHEKEQRDIQIKGPIANAGNVYNSWLRTPRIEAGVEALADFGTPISPLDPRSHQAELTSAYHLFAERFIEDNKKLPTARQVNEHLAPLKKEWDKKVDTYTRDVEKKIGDLEGKTDSSSINEKNSNIESLKKASTDNIFSQVSLNPKEIKTNLDLFRTGKSTDAKAISNTLMNHLQQIPNITSPTEILNEISKTALFNVNKEDARKKLADILREGLANRPIQKQFPEDRVHTTEGKRAAMKAQGPRMFESRKGNLGEAMSEYILSQAYSSKQTRLDWQLKYGQDLDNSEMQGMLFWVQDQINSGVQRAKKDTDKTNKKE